MANKISKFLVVSLTLYYEWEERLNIILSNLKEAFFREFSKSLSAIIECTSFYRFRKSLYLRQFQLVRQLVIYLPGFHVV